MLNKEIWLLLIVFATSIISCQNKKPVESNAANLKIKKAKCCVNKTPARFSLDTNTKPISIDDIKTQKGK